MATSSIIKTEISYIIFYSRFIVIKVETRLEHFLFSRCLGLPRARCQLHSQIQTAADGYTTYYTYREPLTRTKSKLELADIPMGGGASKHKAGARKKGEIDRMVCC